MPIPTPGDPASYPVNIALPAGTDAQNRASFSTPMSELGDRTAYLRARLNAGGDEFIYAATKTRKLTITPASMLPCIAPTTYIGRWFPSRVGGALTLQPLVDAAEVFVPIDLPSGCTISAVEVLVQSAAVRTGSNRWTVRVYEESQPWSSPGAPVATQQGSTTEGGGSSGYSVITVGSLTPFIRVNEYTAHLVITGPTGSLGLNDQLLAARISFTDGGPRNA
jgi:hypothetical protein